MHPIGFDLISRTYISPFDRSIVCDPIRSCNVDNNIKSYI